MIVEKYIPINQLCKHYEIELTFFTGLSEFGLIEMKMVKESPCILEEKTPEIERMIRLYHELNLNFEGLDAVLNLLHKMEELQTELHNTKNRLSLYED